MLESGSSVALTADVPKRARVAGMGIVTLAKLSGRPIVPTAVVAQPPRPVQHLGPRDARPAVQPRDGRRGRLHPGSARRRRRGDGAARLAVQEGLDEAHRRGYAMVGATDPGAHLRTA